VEAKTLAFRLKTLGVTVLRAIEPNTAGDGKVVLSSAVHVTVPGRGDNAMVVRDTLRDGQPCLQYGTPRKELGELLADIRLALEQEAIETDAIRKAARGEA